MRKYLNFSYPFENSEEYFKDLFSTSIIVIDTSALLDLYRYSIKTRDGFFELYRKFNERLWLPHQIVHEYNNNRVSVILEREKQFTELASIIRTGFSNICAKITETQKKYPKFETIDYGKVTKSLDTCLKKEIDKIKSKKSEQPDYLSEEIIRDFLVELFDGKVGEPYSEDRLNEIFKDGEKRYKEKIPPGYLDSEKGGLDQYGDLIFWNQIIDHAIVNQKPVILITSDMKEDWWFVHPGGKLGPRMELIAEMKKNADVSYFQYNPSNFADRAKNYLDFSISEDAIVEAKEIQTTYHKNLDNSDNIAPNDTNSQISIGNPINVNEQTQNTRPGLRLVDNLNHPLTASALGLDHLEINGLDAITKMSILNFHDTLEKFGNMGSMISEIRDDQLSMMQRIASSSFPNIETNQFLYDSISSPKVPEKHIFNLKGKEEPNMNNKTQDEE